MAFAAIRHGHLIVGAVLRDPSWRISIVDMRSMLDWGFEQEGLPPAPSLTPWTNPPNMCMRGVATRRDLSKAGDFQRPNR